MVIMASKKNSKSTPMRVGLYDVGEVIGEGNFSTVRYAKHRHTNSDVAIKIIDKTKLSSSDLEKVYREIQIMKLLNHPHVIKLYQVMETKDMLYLVTEYAPNGEMFDYIVKNGNLTETEARKKFWQILSAVEYCHNSKVVHRDLKAENLLLDGNRNIKICDFGFGTLFQEDSHLATFCGSPPYAAPELFEGHTYKGPEVDIWSLGVVLYVLVCGGLPFYGENLRDLRDRIVKGLFRIPYWMSQECEHLIRHMLVKDPERRYTIEQIKKHRWLNADGIPKPIPGSAITGSDICQTEDYSEQVLRLMEQLGLERKKTVEQLKSNVYDHYSAIYHLLLDRMKLHRSSYPLDKHLTGNRQQRRPSTVAENALSQQRCQQQSFTCTHIPLLQLATEQVLHNPLTASPCQSFGSDFSFSSSVPYSLLSGPPSIASPCSASAESGLEVDMETNDNVSSISKPLLTRRHTLTGMFAGPGTDNLLQNLSGPSVDSGHSIPSESHSFESILDESVYPVISNEQYTNIFGAFNTDNRSPMFNDSKSNTEPNNNREKTRSPINFREGRRASDGLVCQDVIAFRQKLKDGMKAGGMLELRQEHDQLLESFSDITEQSTVQNPPNVKPALGKRMSLPTNSIDLPPHRLLEIKKSIQLDHKLASNYHPVLQRQYTNGRKQAFKQQSALYQQFQQMHLEQTSVVSAACMSGMVRTNKHPPVTRQSSYKMAQQQPVMPPIFSNCDTIPHLSWERSCDKSNFLLPVSNNLSSSVLSDIATSCITVNPTNSLIQEHVQTIPLPNMYGTETDSYMYK